MPRILVLYYSTYGHVEAMAREVARGAATVDGTTVVVKRVPELMPEDVARRAGARLDQEAPIATVGELPDYDAIIFGTPTRFGNMAAQMRNFLDQAGGLWAQNALVGKVGSVFVSTGTGAGNETTLASFHTNLLHFGMHIVGVPYTTPALWTTHEARGGSPLGAGTLAGADGRRMPSTTECEIAAAQGAHVAQATLALLRGRQPADAARGTEAVGAARAAEATSPRDATLAFVRGVYQDIDSLDVDRLLQHLDGDCRFVFANGEAMVGHAAVKAGLGAFMGHIAAMAHEVDACWRTEDTLVSRMRVTYTRRDGIRKSYPAAVIWRMQGVLIRQFEVYVDNSTLFS